MGFNIEGVIMKLWSGLIFEHGSFSQKDICNSTVHWRFFVRIMLFPKKNVPKTAETSNDSSP